MWGLAIPFFIKKAEPFALFLAFKKTMGRLVIVR